MFASSYSNKRPLHCSELIMVDIHDDPMILQYFPGDHQQLQPSATVYELATKYGLETSFFERMIKNGLA